MSTFLLIASWAIWLGIVFVRPSWVPEKARKPLAWTRAQLAELLGAP